MKRLLCLLSSMNAGGAETFLMKVYRALDRSQYQLDFCINVKEKCFYEDEITALGGRIFRIPAKSEDLQGFKSGLSEIVKREGYDHVLRITSSTMGFMDLQVAKKAGAAVCCARSSNASDGGSLKSKVAHIMGRLLYQKYVDVAFAPSDLAAIYTFGKKNYESGRVKILHNAVDLSVFSYDEEARHKIREELSIPEGATVLGHVGRFMEQKNHAFLADIFKSIHDKHPNTVLLLVGDGPLRPAFEQKITELGLREQVIFAGIRSDVPKLLSAMDVFVFPSFYEGMPNTVIEAQATGLPCVIADTITREADITGLVTYVPLSVGADGWRDAVEPKLTLPRRDTKEDFYHHRYDIRSVAEDFVHIVWADQQ